MQKQQLQELYRKKSKMPMYSKAGRVFEKQLLLNSNHAKEIEKNNKSENLHNYKRIDNNNQSKSTICFKSVSRQKKDSFHLRFAKDINVKSNYDPKYNVVMNSTPKYKQPSTQFQRRIDVDTQSKDKYINVKGTPKNKRCQRSIKIHQSKSLVTPKDLSQWRKEHHQMDFTKQILYKHKFDQENSTGYDTFKSKRAVTQYNQQYQNRSQLKCTHNFDSYLPHKYLDIKPEKQIPITDILNANFNRIKPYWDPQKSHIKFDLFTNQIKVKQDRSQQIWNNLLQYYPKYTLTRKKLFKKVQIKKSLPRQQNLVISKYPIRMSQRMDYNLRQYPTLKTEVVERSSNKSVI